GPARVTQLGSLLVMISFAAMFALPLLSPSMQLVLIAVAAVGFDLGLQSSLVAHQTLVYSLEPKARGRLNALLFTGVFVGMALGSLLGSKAWALGGWPAVVALATFAGGVALVIRLTQKARPTEIAAQQAAR
ncbi:MFS transporter, partial [Cronobacter malonaticus]